MNKNGLLFGLFSVVSYSANAPLSRAIMLEGMTPVTLLLLRFLVAGAVFTVIMRISGMAKAKDGDLAMSRRGLMLAVLGGIMNGISALAYYFGLLHLDASFAAMLGAAVYSVTAILIGSFISNGLSAHTILRLVLGLIGLYFLLGPSGGDVSLLGVGLVSFSSLIFGIYLIFIQKYLGDYNTLAVSELSIWGIVLTVSTYWLFFDGGAIQVSSAAGWTTILLQGIVVSIIGRFAMMKAIKEMGGGEYSLLSPLETMLAVVWAMIFLGETLTQAQMVGAVFILSGLVVSGERFANRINGLFAGRRRLAAGRMPVA